MLTRAQSTLSLRKAAKVRQLSRMFGGGGPYNPNRFKSYLGTTKFNTPQEMLDMEIEHSLAPFKPVRNMRHVNPTRQSGPLPPYEGPYTMEDVRKIYMQTHVGYDMNYCSTDPEEIMRRVPGITRKEAEFITRLGLTPWEEIDYAYICYNIGLDVFYLTNQMYMARQVVTNAKGEKVEVYWNFQAWEDLSFVSTGFAPIMEHTDYHWEIFLWGDPPIHPLCDFDLTVPNTWFEYECEWWGEMCMLQDQFSLPEDVRVTESPKHPNASAALWQSQDKLQELEQMKDPEWFPQGTRYNVYNQENWVREPENFQENSNRLRG